MHITVNDTSVPVQVTVPLKAEVGSHLYDVGTLIFDTDDSRTAHLDTAAIADVVRQAEDALSSPHPSKDVSGQHTVTLNGATPALTHPTACTDPDTCPFTAAVTTLTSSMLATRGTWTCDLHDGSLILLKRISIAH